MAKSGKLERTLQRILSREGAKSQRRNTGNSDPLNLSFLSRRPETLAKEIDKEERESHRVLAGANRVAASIETRFTRPYV
jgi:hypothetical protein